MGGVQREMDWFARSRVGINVMIELQSALFTRRPLFCTGRLDGWERRFNDQSTPIELIVTSAIDYLKASPMPPAFRMLRNGSISSG